MSPDTQIVKLTNCRLAVGDALVWRDLWLSGTTGKIIDPQLEFFSQNAQPSVVHDLGGRTVAPGFVEVQINGGYGFDFSVPSDHYAADLQMLNHELVKTGVTSYVPTLTSQRSEVYHQTIPHLAAPLARFALTGSESLGAHCEGPFINPLKNGIHRKDVLQTPSSISALLACYGADNLNLTPTRPPRVRKITLAPELDASETVIRELRARGIVVSVGHSTATYEQMRAAVDHGATMITHLFNAMSQPHHRDTGIFGILGWAEGKRRPYYGLIADDVHVHPSMVRVAYRAHPEGCCLVTDAMSVLGLKDGDYAWTNGEVIEKMGSRLTLKGTGGTIAGSSVTLIECLVNLTNWAEVPLATALKTVTWNPARMLGLEATKGTLSAGADADLVVLTEGRSKSGQTTLHVDEVWKFGVRVHKSPSPAEKVVARL